MPPPRDPYRDDPYYADRYPPPPIDRYRPYPDPYDRRALPPPVPRDPYYRERDPYARPPPEYYGRRHVGLYKYALQSSKFSFLSQAQDFNT